MHRTRRAAKYLPWLAVAILLPAQAAAQEAPATPAARAADVASPDAIIAAVYDVISGPAGQARDWDRFRSLFMPGARLIPTGARPDGGFGQSVLTAEDYVTRAGPGLERDGFFEREIHRVEERFGPVLHAFSTYESRRTAADPEPFARGVNSFQFFWDGTRWWVTTIYWFAETDEHPLPARYLPSGR